MVYIGFNPPGSVALERVFFIGSFELNSPIMRRS